jgi:hypothetical protein
MAEKNKNRKNKGNEIQEIGITQDISSSSKCNTKKSENKGLGEKSVVQTFKL